MWLIFALVALFFWSGSDLFSKMGSNPQDKLSHWKMVMMVGGVMGLHAMVEIFVFKTPISLNAIITYLPASLLYIISMIMGYIALRYIELSISSPICNSSGAVAALLCFIVLGQKMALMQTIAVIVICIGVILLGITEYFEDENSRKLRQLKANRRYSKSFLAILLPVLYCIIDALGTFADSIILENMEEKTANVAYELTFLVMAIFAAVYVFVIKKDKLTHSADSPKLLGGICETAGQLAYVYAIGAYPIGAAPVISAYCVVSVLWSRIFLKEKLSYKHYASIIIAIIGIIMLALYEGLVGDV